MTEIVFFFRGTVAMSQGKLGAEGPGFIGIRFCQECNNMLYPKEDKVSTGIKLIVHIVPPGKPWCYTRVCTEKTGLPA